MYKNAEDLNRITLKDQGMAEFLPGSLGNVSCGEDHSCRVPQENIVMWRIGGGLSCHLMMERFAK